MKFSGLVFLAVTSCLFASEPVLRTDTFEIISVSKENGDFALSHLDQTPATFVFSENIKSIQQAIDLVYQNLSFTGSPKRVGIYKKWILFPRLDIAKDDFSFSSGYAVRIGSNTLVHWNAAEPGAAANP